MTRRNVLGGVAGGLVAFYLLTGTAATTQAQSAQQGGLPALAARVQALEQAMARMSSQQIGVEQLLDLLNQALGMAEAKIADLQLRSTDLEAALSEIEGGLTSFDQLAGRACTSAAGAASRVALIGRFKTPVCGEVHGEFIDYGPTVLHTRTNLMWEKKTTTVGSGESHTDLHDVDNRYSWCATPGVCMSAVTAWIAQVNGEHFAGYRDWRLPSREELLTIVDTSAAACGSGAACIPSIFGPTHTFQYLSSTEFNDELRWGVLFYTGEEVFVANWASYHARAVRSAP